jgi:membrane protein DedA with SNARE-associated domain
MMPGLRTFISLPAGIARMNFGKFLLFSLLGSIPWNVGLAYVGYAAGKAAGDNAWKNLQSQFDRYNMIFYVVLALVVIAFVVWGVWRWRRHKNTAAKQAEGAED